MRQRQKSHSEFYKMTDTDKKDYVNYIERKIKREKMKKPLFFKMYQLTKEVINHYQTDFFVHDYNKMTIESDGTAKFLWIVYDCGTQMVNLENNFIEELDDRYEYFQILKNNYNDKTTRLFILDTDQETLTETTYSEVNKNSFTHKYGKTEDYFTKKTAEIGYENYQEKNKQFKELMEMYRNHPPKKIVDDIINEKIKCA
ncbi:hypothetical protein AAGG74_16060 [Bacillus mexicanus]|uniref:hypothetical protein n=1 Tax=Bacillus mexicanus TaxID=2834415 RepID=UPI003D2539BF